VLVLPLRGGGFDLHAANRIDLHDSNLLRSIEEHAEEYARRRETRASGLLVGSLAREGVTEQQTPSAGIAPTLAVIAGVLAIAGSVVKWATASAGGFSTSARGIDGGAGKLTIVCGIVLLVAGVSSFVGAPGGRSRLRVSALVGGLGAGALGTYNALTAKSQLVDSAIAEFAKEFNVSREVARQTVEPMLEQITVSVDIGLYVVIAAGIIGIVAGILAITHPAARTSQAPTQGAGLTGWSTSTRPPVPAPPPMPMSPSAESPSPWAIPPGETTPAGGCADALSSRGTLPPQPT
jgi:hypothetical protein